MVSGYCAAITAMDANIGRLIDWLETQGLRESTLIVFTADNGMNMGHHGIWGKGNGTYPPNMFDTATKVPTLMSRPGHAPEGIVNTDLLSHYDLMPTLLDYAGLDGYESADLPGRSFARVLKGEATGRDRPVSVRYENGPTRMTRNRPMTYHHRHPDGLPST